jgi:pyrroline-5-carboxylate reductase
MTPSLQDAKITFLGGGNMAAAIIGGLLAKNISKSNIYVSEPWDVNRNKMADLGVKTTADNKEAAADADVVILAVKPQVAKGVCEELSSAWAKRDSLPVVISIAAGITLESIAQWFKGDAGKAPHIVRVMPNTPALVGEGASGLYAADDVTKEERELTSALLGSVSKATEWVDKEELLDVVTGISGKLLISICSRKFANTSRLWPRLLLRFRRASYLQRYRSRTLRGAGYSSRYTDLPRCWKDAC